MTEKELKQAILKWCENRMKMPMNTAEAKDISEIYVNLVKQDKLAETMDRIANNTFVPPPTPEIYNKYDESQIEEATEE
jgi:hypothetical protein